MKSRIRTAIIFAGILIVIGVMGCVFSGIRLVPTISNEISRVQNESESGTPIESVVYSSDEVISSINIASIEKSNINVEIKKSNSDKTIVKAYDDSNNNVKVNTRFDEENSALYVEGYSKKTDLFQANSLKKKIMSLYNRIIYTLAQSRNNTSQIVIEVPRGVDIDFKSSHQSSLVIRNKDVLNNNLSFKSIGGTIQLPTLNSLKNISIDTNGYIRLDVLDFINADDVEIKGYNIDISSSNNADSYYNVKSYPSSVKLEGEIININSYIPIGKITALSGSEVTYMGNFEKYPLNLELSGGITSKCTYNELKSSSLNAKKTELYQNYKGIIGTGKKSVYTLEISDYNICELSNK